jgi:hypothetical protein
MGHIITTKGKNISIYFNNISPSKTFGANLSYADNGSLDSNKFKRSAYAYDSLSLYMSTPPPPHTHTKRTAAVSYLAYSVSVNGPHCEANYSAGVFLRRHGTEFAHYVPEVNVALITFVLSLSSILVAKGHDRPATISINFSVFHNRLVN